MIEMLTIEALTVRAERPARPTQPPVLFIHGYFATATIFDRWLAYFAARGFPAFAVNLRGRAGSRPGTNIGTVSLADFVDDASVVAREVGARTIVGHSMGGLIAQKLAERGDAARAALICPAPPRGISVLSLPVLARQVKYLPAILAARAVHPRADDIKAIVLNCVPPAEQAALLAELCPDSGRAAREMSFLGVPVDASRVRCPIIVFTADEDRFIPKRIVQRVAARYAAPIQSMAGHGHMLPCESGWEAVADKVVSWASG